MNAIGGIGAPETVPEGSHAPIEISGGGPGVELTVTVIGSGERVFVQLDEQGRGRFELPATAVSGEIISIVDMNDPTVSAAIEVVPATRV